MQPEGVPSPLVAALYSVFAHYSPGEYSFCELCYSPSDVEYLKRTPVNRIDSDLGRRLLWEPEDHWESPDVYRHYLPRILELLGHPWRVEEIYPGHLSEILISSGFRWWPDEERRVVPDYLESLPPEFVREESLNEWTAGLAALKRPTLLLPPIPG